MLSMLDVKLPPGFNGVPEVGVAAGVDELTIPKYLLRILYKLDVPWGRALEVLRGAFNADNAKGKPTIDESAFTPEALRALGVKSRGDIKAKAQLPPLPEPVPHVKATLMANPSKHSHKAVTAAYCQLVAFLISSGLIPAAPGNKNVTHLSVENSVRFFAAAEDERAKGTPGYLTEAEVDEALANPREPVRLATLAISTKISWWITNHHVGQDQGIIRSYAGKVVKLDPELAAADQAEVRLVLWAVGKYCVTIPVLEALGIPNLLQQTDPEYPAAEIPLKPQKFTGSEDVMLRAKARPAGTADPCTYLAICRFAAASMYSVLLPAVVAYDNAKAKEAEIIADPARFHMGAKFLTGKDRDDSAKTAFTDEDKTNLSAFIHATAPQGNLAKAEVIMPKNQIEGTTVFSLISGVRAEISTMAATAFLKALMRRAAPGIDTGGFARQVNLITDETIAQARAEAEQESSAVPPNNTPAVSST